MAPKPKSAPPARPPRPTKGGSYIQAPDGSARRVQGLGQVETLAPAEPVANPPVVPEKGETP